MPRLKTSSLRETYSCLEVRFITILRPLIQESRDMDVRSLATWSNEASASHLLDAEVQTTLRSARDQYLDTRSSIRPTHPDFLPWLICKNESQLI